MRTAFEAGDIKKAREIQNISHTINNIRFKYGGTLTNTSDAIIQVVN